MTKDQLERLKELNKALKHADDEISRLRSQAERTTAMVDGLPKGSPLSSLVSESAVKLVSMAEELQMMTVERQHLINVLTVESMRLPDSQAAVIRSRYIECRSFAQIAQSLNCGVSNIFKLHRLALKELFLN